MSGHWLRIVALLAGSFAVIVPDSLAQKPVDAPADPENIQAALRLTGRRGRV